MRRMRGAVLGVVAIVSLLAGLAVTRPASAVFYGQAVDAKSVPWVVALLDANRADPWKAQFCGGQIIDTHWVLTASHCVIDLPPGRIQVVQGVTNLRAIKATDRRAVAQKITHPGYDPNSFMNDVALLRLAQPVPAAWVLKMNTNPSVPAPNARMTVHGWGLTDKGWAEDLQRGDVFNQQRADGTCARYPSVYRAGQLAPYLAQFNICALGPLPGETTKSVDACSGDSGGPLIVNTPTGPVLVGTVDWGRGFYGLGLNADSNAVYMRTSAFVPWIQGILNTTPRVSLSDATVVERNPANGNTTIKFTASLDQRVREVVRVDFTTVNGSAVAGSDYRGKSGTIVIPANALSATIGVTVLSDKVKEGNESFIVALSNSRIARMGRGGGIGTIIDND